MTLGEFLKKTENINKDIPLILSSDEEGNSHRYLYNIENVVCEEDGYNLDIVDESDIDDVEMCNYKKCLRLY